uniref:laminin subunit beta-2 isoform X3 n=1 Tax=Ciona intestinalis TaxID=7719 RepID=UPI000EF496D6|nr:laminin subunit beta-2 isoform X3 [Ciona intestinalis]|eukprot:XP_026694945.1 laminin subunit beta-2 isoform X3 [Ciona intestinalis]
MRLLLCVAVIAIGIETAFAQGGCAGSSCFPSTGDLLVGRGDMLSSTSTCGQEGRERYCIVSHLKDVRKCFTCDASVPAQAHEVSNVITTQLDDRLLTWWQSESGQQRVSIQLDLEAEFQFTHMIMTFKTFRPAAMFIERSMDFGKTWAVYRYFAYDCDKSFPGIPEWPPREIDDVICDSRYSLIEPSNGGEVIYRVLEPFITIDDPYVPRIQNLLKITNLRFNFTELHTLGDDLLDSRNDIKNKYYYALYELIVRGNCFCYGHADECTPINGAHRDAHTNSVMDNAAATEVHGRCRCQHNTVGLNCEQCLPFYQDQPWRPAEAGMPHECKACNCNNHATECHFDPAVYAATGQVSGGVCENCQHNTVGRNCEQCASYYYQDASKDIRDPTVCVACDCDVAGSLDDGICDGLTDPDLGMIAGQCRCKQYVQGQRCDQCRDGYFGLDANNPNGCTACDCDSLGTLSGANTCDSETGQCICKRFTTGRRCDMCVPQTWGMSAIPHGCNECDCDIGGAYDNDCNQASGQCNCRPNINHRRCDSVISGNFLPGLDYYLYEAEDAEIQKGAFEDKRKHVPPLTWTGDGFMLVQEEGVIIFTVNNLPKSMDYNLVLRYQSTMPNMWQYVDVTIDRPNRGNIPTSSPCGNTRPEDDEWMTSLPGPPTTHSSLGIICLESKYTYRIILDMRRYQREHDPNGLTPDILIDSLLVVPVHSGLDMFQGTIEGRQRTRQFTELECEESEMYVPDRTPHEECADLLFSMSAIIHDGAKPCDCNPQGSTSSICETWAGQCQCKPNVIGRKCDRCAPGTYGFGPTGCRECDCDALGSRNEFCDIARGQCECLPGVSGRRCNQCMPGHYDYPNCYRCNCNGHTDSCDQETGECLGCRDNTMGAHCDSCIDGYYGNPLLGSLDQCKACMCPDGPGSGRQYSTGCRQDQVSGQVVCYCMPGYAGARCDQCAPAYWGNPQTVNGLCRKCECNNNIDPFDPTACDSATGVCTNCLHNTAGPHCEQCRDYYYGNPLDQNCMACQCNLLGTDSSVCVNGQCQCDATTGQCPCYPNVSGQNCDQCLPNHWKLASGTGCESCGCSPEHSLGTTCNEITGQCLCVDGFGGRTCHNCADGYFGNPDIECYATPFPLFTTVGPTTTTTTTEPKLSETATTKYPSISTTTTTENSNTFTTTTSTQKPGISTTTISTTKSTQNPSISTTTTKSTTTSQKPGISTSTKTITATTGTKFQETTTFSFDTTTTKTTTQNVSTASVTLACECNIFGSVSTQCNTNTGQCECRDGVGGRRCDRCLRGFTGEVPNCEPCGECFDNWDVIISQLKDRTDRAISRAREIGETGITGAYNEEFELITELLKNISANALEMPKPDFMAMVETIQNRLKLQEDKLVALEHDMTRIRNDDTKVNEDMISLDEQAVAVNAKLDNLRDQKQSISKVSPVAAFKQVEDAAAASEAAERAAQAATTEPGNLLEQSQQIRDAVEADLDDKQSEFDFKLSQVNDDITARQSDVNDLTLSELNKDICGAATEGCDESCGGAGCDTCGGIGCTGAVQFASDAKNRAQKTQETLTRVADETGDLRNRVQLAKTSAQEAKNQAQEAHTMAQEVESVIRQQNSEVRKLIQDIREFLEEEKADPNDIKDLANQVLALSLPVSRSEIDALAEEIRDLVDRLPNVDEILAETDGDLERANQLLADANQAKQAATAVASDAKAVVTALSQADNASRAAEAAKTQAANDIQLAEDKINEIKSAITDLEGQMTGISNRIGEFTERLNAVEHQLTENKLSLGSALDEATAANATANMALQNLQGQSALINEATSAINEKKDKTDRLAALRRKAQELTDTVAQNQQQFESLSDQLDSYDRQLNMKNDRLDALLAEVERLYSSIQLQEKYLRNC